VSPGSQTPGPRLYVILEPSYKRRPTRSVSLRSRMKTLLVAPFINLSHTATVSGDASGSELSRLQVTRKFSGDLEGESSGELLLCRTPGGVLAYAGTDHFIGKVKGRSGAFLFQHAGVLENGRFQGMGYVVPDSATNELAGLRGKSAVQVSPSGEHSLHLELETAP
jgi:Protein of unknown function (DUF3224)